MIAAPNPAALLIYLLCAASGSVVEKRFVLNSLLKRVLVIYAAGAAQAMVTIEVLSLATALTGWNLILANLVLTGVILLFRKTSEGRLSWRELLRQAADDLNVSRKDWPTLSLLVVGGGFFVLAAIVGSIMVPFNDSYHFEMPRFWLQNRSAYPFPCHNPRITTITFLSEAIQFPGFIAFRNEAAIVVATLITAALALSMIYSLARRLGASVVASAAATAISVEYFTLASSIYTAAAEMLLSGAFFGGSLLFLMDAWAKDSEKDRSRWDELGLSVFMFVMACGAKNPTVVVAPFYLMFLAIAILRAGDIRKCAFALFASGFIGLICSGVAWNYGANKIYFGERGMPPLMKAAVSHGYGPRDIWTRMVRGGVLVFYDTMWVPNSARDQYRAVVQKTVKVLGGKETLREDDLYYSFKAEPMKGFGPPGIAFLIPSLAFACVRSVRMLSRREHPMSVASLNLVTLTALTIASFVMVHLVLRWQFIGMVRLMFPIVIAGAPLAALLLDRRWLRTISVGLMAMVAAIFFVYWSGMVSRRVGRSDTVLVASIARLQNDRSILLHYTWRDQPTRELLQREDFTYRQIYETVLEGLHQPCAIGFIGNENSEALYLFGTHSQNRIISMVDAVEEDRVMNVSGDRFDYVVAADKFDQAQNWARAHGFERIMWCTGPKGDVAMVFEKARR